MNKILKWALIALLLVGIIGGATILYNNLGDDYKKSSLKINSIKENGSDESDDSAEINLEDFEMLDYEGNDVKLSDYSGKPIVLNFWATWCHYCKEEMPDFNKAFKKYSDVQFIMVNVTDGIRETVDSAKEYVEDNNYKFDVFFDVYGQAVATYNVTAYPTTFFIDAKGNVVASSAGMLDYDELVEGIELITK